ncbi:MAG: carboxypeptidase regulatory-like domain-containing protein [Gemmatimonadetes bacterium]|nr:carboxypeptidase regulatory-like domain-containing protein [Gemmatimonadota bacterium]
MTRTHRVAILFATTAVATGALHAQESGCDRPVVEGRVTDSSGQIPLPGAGIVVHWSDPSQRPIRLASDALGAFRLCPPRAVAEATVWAEFGDYTSPHVTVDLTSPRAVSLAIDIEAEAGARLVGRVSDGRTGNPIAGADVRIAERAVAISGSMGQFVVTGLRAGRFLVRVSHLGYETLEETVELSSGLTLELDLGLTADPVELEPLFVSTVRLRKLETQGFYERKTWHERLGSGTFFSRDDVERRRPTHISHLIADAPGIRLSCSSGLRGCHLRSARPGCAPQIYLDGVHLRGTSIDEVVQAIEVGGIEVYDSVSSLPAEFGGADAQCGAVIVWTR